MADYENMVFYRCPRCSQIGYASCNRCGEVDIFKLEADFAACACGQDIDESRCSCGAVAEGSLYFVDEELQKPEKDKIERAEERENLATKFDYKKIFLLIVLILIGLVIYSEQGRDKDWEYHYSAQTIIKGSLKNPNSFEPLYTKVIWRDDKSGDYIVRTEFMQEKSAGEKVSGCKVVAIKFRTGQYSWEKDRGITSCNAGKKLTEVEIKQIVFMNGFRAKRP